MLCPRENIDVFRTRENIDVLFRTRENNYGIHLRIRENIDVFITLDENSYGIHHKKSKYFGM